MNRAEYNRWKAKDLYYRKKKEILEKQRVYRKNRRATDSIYKAKCNLRRRVRDVLTKKTWQKSKSYAKYIGCTSQELKMYIESLFQMGMTWDNYGEWHIDHIVPLSSVNTEEELYKLSHYTNLQPLWAEDNLKKSNK